MSQLEDLLQQCTVKLTLPGRMGWGTGFFVAPKWILTCAHVVQEVQGQPVQVWWQKQENWGQAVVEQLLPDPYDLALLRVTLPADAKSPCVYLDEMIQSRDPLYLFGYPDQDFPNGCPVTFNCEGLTGDEPALIKFASGQVRPGMSGSPLLNQRTGKVCGVVKFTRDRSIDLGGGAIPTRVILEQFPQLRELQQQFHQRDHRWNVLVATLSDAASFLQPLPGATAPMTQNNDAGTNYQTQTGEGNTNFIGGVHYHNINDRATNSHYVDRLTYLQELQQESRARCIVRWLAAGVSEQTAEEFADDPRIGNPPSNLQLIPGKIVLVTGAMGAGKSLVAERLFQNVVIQAIQDADAPIPTYLESGEWFDGRPLKKIVETAAKNLGNPKIQGAIVIINDVDRVISLASDLLAEARFLVKAWRNTTVVITSRPLRTLAEAEDIIQVQVPELTVNQACTLISRVAGQPVTEYMVSQWSSSLQSVIKLPLFALLVADYLRSQNFRVSQSTGELLNNLIRNSLGKETADRESANQFLQILAVQCIQYGGGPVDFSEVVASRAELQPKILTSRLVIERHNKIGFTLPILNEWFAAQSLVAGNPAPELLAQDVEQLESWRYPLIIAIATAGHDQVSRFLTPIVKAHPAFASEIVSEALASRFIDMPPPPWRVCGQRLRESMQVWAIGLNQPPSQSLAQFIAPVGEDCIVQTIGVRSEAEELTIGWYQGSEEIADVVELPPLSEAKDFFPIRSIRSSSLHRESASVIWIGPQPAWAWLWTLDKLVESLSKLLQKRGLSINYGLLANESLWKLARSVLSCSRNSSYRFLSPHRAVPLNILEAVLAEFAPNIQLFNFSGVRTIYRQDLDRLSMEIAKLRTLGCTEIAPSWEEPKHYSVEEFPWKSYSLKQIQAYAERVYLEALSGYRYTVDTWLPKFADRLELSVLMPVHLVGSIAFSDFDNEPSLYWHLEALPYGESNKVSFSIMEQSVAQEEFLNLETRERVDNQRHALRPGKASLIGNTSFWHGGLCLFEPTSATELVYNWLWDDLKQVSWVNVFLGSPPR
jgi:Trypsin-like peptidase domain